MSVIFNEFDLATIGTCGEPVLEFANFEPQFEDVQSSNGSKFIGTRIAAGHVEFSITLIGTAEERRVKASKLASLLNVDEPKELVLPDAPGWSYKAIPDAGVSFERHIDGEIGKVSFALVDPVAYGEETTVSVAAGATSTVLIGGTAPTRPVITATGARGTSPDYLWGVEVDGGEFVKFKAQTASALMIDCENRHSTVDGAISLPTIDSDWLVLAPGVHSIANVGFRGTAVITWRERWL